MIKIKKVEGMYFPVWIHLIHDMNANKHYKNISNIARETRFTYCIVYTILQSLVKKGFIYRAKEGIMMTEKGKELQKYISFIFNYIR